MAERPTVVLLPGLLCDAEVWSAPSAALRERCEVVTPGFMDFSSIGAMADHVLRTAPYRFSVAGHSMGGRAALEIVRRAPHRVDRLALVDTGFHAARAGEAAGRYALIALAEAEGMRALARRWLPPMMSPTGLADADLMERLTAMIERADAGLFRRQIDALLSRPDAGPGLHDIDCPTHVLVGRQDGWSPLQQHQEMAARIRGSKLVVLEDCGHMSLVEQPEAVAEALVEWMATPDARDFDDDLVSPAYAHG